MYNIAPQSLETAGGAVFYIDLLIIDSGPKVAALYMGKLAEMFERLGN